MRDHEYYQELMSRLLDEGLTAREERELKEHVRSCSECAKLFSVFSAVTVSLREDMAEPPAALSRGVMDRIAADKEERPRVIHVQRPELERERPKRRSKRGWTGLAAAACLVLVIGGGAFWFLRDKKTLPLDDAAPEAAMMRAAENAAVAGTGEEEDVPEAISAEGDAADAAMPMTAEAAMAEDIPEAVSVEGDTAEDAAMPMTAEAAMATPAPSPTATPAPEPLTVMDVARRDVGTISVDNIPAFTALLEGGQVIGGAQGDWEFLFSVTYGDREISFATDENEKRLVWWDGNTPVTAAHGSLESLRNMIELSEAPLPQ